MPLGKVDRARQPLVGLAQTTESPVRQAAIVQDLRSRRTLPAFPPERVASRGSELESGLVTAQGSQIRQGVPGVYQVVVLVRLVCHHGPSVFGRGPFAGFGERAPEDRQAAESLRLLLTCTDRSPPVLQRPGKIVSLLLERDELQVYRRQGARVAAGCRKLERFEQARASCRQVPALPMDDRDPRHRASDSGLVTNRQRHLLREQVPVARLVPTTESTQHAPCEARGVDRLSRKARGGRNVVGAAV